MRHLEGALGLLGLLVGELFLHRLDVRWRESAGRVWLPLGKVEHLELEWWINEFLAAAIEHVNHVVDFDSLVQHTGHQVLPIGCPLDSNGAVRARFANLLQLFERPNVNLSLQVAKATNQEKLREGTNTDRVSIAFAKLKESIAVFVVEGCNSRLISSNDDELFTRFDPVDIIDHVLEDGDELTLAASENLHVLQAVLAVVALA